MAHMLKPPAPLPDDLGRSVFLAGTIDMGSSVDWQTAFAAALEPDDITILNPRRDEWDASWVQSIDNDQFRGQVEWELEGLERADVIVCYFAPGSQSPVTLLELGLNAKSGRMVVCCPDGFWRKGNIDIVCRRYGVTQVGSTDELVDAVRAKLT